MSEPVYSDIRVTFERTQRDGYTDLRIVRVENTGSELTAAEAEDLVETMVEANNSHEIINALLFATAGETTERFTA